MELRFVGVCNILLIQGLGDTDGLSDEEGGVRGEGEKVTMYRLGV